MCPPNTSKGNDAESELKGKWLYRGFEGGSVHCARRNEEWVVVTNETTLLDLLSDADRKEMNNTGVRIYSFPSSSERDLFLKSRFPLPLA